MGCSGTVGAPALELLGPQVVGIVRAERPQLPILPARYRRAEHTDLNSLTRALDGCQALLIGLGTHPQQVQTESLAIKAAQRAGVQRIIKISAPVTPMPVEVADWHRAIEAQLEASGLEFCCLRPSAFYQNWLRSARIIRHGGVILASSGSGTRNHVDARDVAEVAVRMVLEGSSTPYLELRGLEVISAPELARQISRLSGSSVHFHDLSPQVHFDHLTQSADLPDWLANHLIELDALARLHPEGSSDSLKRALGRSPRCIEDFLYEHRYSFMNSG